MLTEIVFKVGPPCTMMFLGVTIALTTKLMIEIIEESPGDKFIKWRNQLILAVLYFMAFELLAIPLFSTTPSFRWVDAIGLSVGLIIGMRIRHNLYISLLRSFLKKVYRSEGKPAE